MGHAAKRKLPFQKDFLTRLRGFPIMQDDKPRARAATAPQILVHHVAVRRRRLLVDQQVVERQRRMLEEDFAADGAQLLADRRPVTLSLRIPLRLDLLAVGGKLLRIAVHRRRLRNVFQRPFRQRHVQRSKSGRVALSAPPLLRRQFLDDGNQSCRQVLAVFNHKTMAAADMQVLIDPARHLRELLVQFVPALHGSPCRRTHRVQRISHPPIRAATSIFVTTADDREFRVLFIQREADVAVRMGEPPFIIILSGDVQLLVDFILVDANLIPLRPRAFDLSRDRGFRRAVSFCKNRIDPAGMVAAVAVAAVVHNQPKFIQSGHIRRQRDRPLGPFDIQFGVQRFPCARRQGIHFRYHLGASLLPAVDRAGHQTSAYRQQYQQKGSFHDGIPMVYVAPASPPSGDSCNDGVPAVGRY